jgi:hypothetical protein
MYIGLAAVTCGSGYTLTIIFRFSSMRIKPPPNPNTQSVPSGDLVELIRFRTVRVPVRRSMSCTVVSGLILVDSSPKYNETYLCFEEIGAAEGEIMKVATGRYLDAAGR